MPLPAGVTLDPSTGVLSGLPTSPGTYSGTIQAQDVLGNTFILAFILVVEPIPVFTTPSTLPQGEVGVAYSLQLTATGGTPPYSNFQVTS